MERTFNFIKSKLDELPAPSKGKVYYSDTKESGLKLYVTSSGVKTFCLRKKVQGRDGTKTFGNYPDQSIENARKACAMAKGSLANGINIFEANSETRKDITLGKVIEEYIHEYSELHKKPKTVKEEKRYADLYLSKLAKKKLTNVINADLRKLHKDISDSNGKTIANRVIEFLRALFNWKIAGGWKGENPAKNIKMNKEIKRDRFLSKDEIKQLTKSLDIEHNEIARDFFYLCLLTTARRSNILAMRWEEIDFEAKTWRIPVTKNDEPHTIPLLSEAIDILNLRKTRNDKLGFDKSEFVLPAKSKSGHLAEPKSAWKRILKRTDITKVRIHDLRRTTASYMTMSGINLQTIGKTLGHKNPASTAIYARLNHEPVIAGLENASSIIFDKISK